MKAVVKTSAGPGFEWTDVPEPTPGPNDVKFRVLAAAVCGTDIHFNRWDSSAINFVETFNIQLPFITGHECCGEIVEVGKAVKNFRPGDRISLETHIPCGHCYQCQNGMAHNCANMLLYGMTADGCFSDYALAPASVAFKLPDGVSNEEGCIFEPAGVAMRAVEEGEILPGDTVLVYGCGPIGLMTVQLLQACNAAKIIAVDVDEYRLGLAARYGVETINAARENVGERVADMTRARGGVDVLLELTGSDKVYDHLFSLVRLEGRVVTIGHPGKPVLIDITRSINFRGIRLKGVFGRRIWFTWWKLAAMVEAKKLDVLDIVTHRFAFPEFRQAFDQVDKGAGKILFINQGHL